jgi:hypothetical protein
MKKLQVELPQWTVKPELLLHPNVPKPLHGVAPRTVLGINWWNRERRACYRSTLYHCEACGVHKEDAKYHQWLEAHEVYEIDYRLGRMVYVRAVPLCHFCHNSIHDGRLQWLLQTQQIHHAKYVAILQHGEEVLRKAGLSRQSRIDRDREILTLEAKGLVADWSAWRLVVNGVEYPPIYNSYQEWLKHYAEGRDEVT